MQKFQRASAWRQFGPFVLALLALAAVAVWAKSAIVTSNPAVAGGVAPVEASAAIAPMELMIRHGRELPTAEYVEPF
jgi:hypothetical protein